MSNVYLFDVDGTLTHPRNPMSERFAEFFYGFCRANLVYLVSGSDYGKICEQVPDYILERCRGVYGCSGATFHVKGMEVYARDHVFDPELISYCEASVQSSGYIFKTGNHIEFRTGMLNISSVGRNADSKQRSDYYHWDQKVGERKRIVEQINKKYTEYEASAGGEISIDIVPIGWNKSVVKKHVLEQHPAACLHFFGDRIVDGGNDLPLAVALDDGTGFHQSHAVTNFNDTWRMLECGLGTPLDWAA